MTTWLLRRHDGEHGGARLRADRHQLADALRRVAVAPSRQPADDIGNRIGEGGKQAEEEERARTFGHAGGTTRRCPRPADGLVPADRCHRPLSNTTLRNCRDPRATEPESALFRKAARRIRSRG
jgi:hypothetical protein